MHVLRLQTGDRDHALRRLAAANIDGELIDIAKRAATARIDEHSDREAEPPYRVTLAQGVAGGDKMDWLIEKAVELGVAAIVPITAERGVVRLAGERALKRQAHWQALTRAACEQCGRNRVPDVAPPRDLDAWLADLPAVADGELRLLLSPRAEVSFASLPADAAARPRHVTDRTGSGFFARGRKCDHRCGIFRARPRPARIAHRNGGHRGAGGAGRALGRMVIRPAHTNENSPMDARRRVHRAVLV